MYHSTSTRRSTNDMIRSWRQISPLANLEETRRFDIFSSHYNLINHQVLGIIYHKVR